MATFYVVATPIGNLEDITLRAIRVLKEVDLILCEDTRVTGKLLGKYEIGTKMMSYHTQSKLSKIDHIIEMLEESKDIALVSDAGTPTISDPGSLLVKKIREELPDLKIVAVPGASALTAAFSISGLTGGDFLFLGFLPHKKGRETLFKEISESNRTTIFYESPHRIIKTLESLEKVLGSQKVIVAREVTKMYEEVVSGTASEVLNFFSENVEKVRGEFVVMVESSL
jgi:16S rRNA (cytidine1402-2'-O)-methyltransferase